jgi:hypothetical protein
LAKSSRRAVNIQSGYPHQAIKKAANLKKTKNYIVYLKFWLTFKYIWFAFPSHFNYTDIDLIFDEPADLILD